MKIFGFSHGAHDSSYAILEDGKVLVHEELERRTRVKQTNDDVVDWYVKNVGPLDEFDYIAFYPHGSGHDKTGDFPWYSQKFLELWLEKRETVNGNQGVGTPYSHMKNKVVEVSHHAGHAANAFYASDFKEALIFSIDGGGSGREPDGMLYWSAFEVWIGRDNEMEQIVHENSPSVGIIWHDMTRDVFKLSPGGPPSGCQSGTVMGMAAYGDASKYTEEESMRILRYDFAPFYDRAGDKKFDIAALLQKTTEDYVVSKVKPYIEKYGIKNVCFTGGVSLNCAMMGKLKKALGVDNIFVPPVPYDSGLAIGCAQYLYHCILKQPRSYDVSYKTPYLGGSYGEDKIYEALGKHQNNLTFRTVTDEEVCDLLAQQKVISIFSGRSESGRRALGNRSILADPRNAEIKDTINAKIKHREWFRPFAPSVLSEHVSEWFDEAVDSPYMSFSLPFKEDKKPLVPAVVHKDGTGRLQTVFKSLNPRYYQLIQTWYKKTGVPMLLNTSFNDREPIVETPTDAVNCFLKTRIDNLYFADYNILVSKNISDRSKILVAQFYTSNVPYGKFSREVNEKYCSDKGYSYYCERDSGKIVEGIKDRAPTWYKPKLVLEMFEKFNPEYVLFMDIDAAFNDFEDNIENYIDSKYDLTFTQDYGGHSRMNAGVFIAKNTDWVKTFMQTWWDTGENAKGGDCVAMRYGLRPESMDQVGYYKNALWHDQSCLTLLYDENKEVRQKLKIIPHRKLNWSQTFEGNFIFHGFAHGHAPFRRLDYVHAKIFNTPTSCDSLYALAETYPVTRNSVHGFFKIYEEMFREVDHLGKMLEIGMENENSLEIWRQYLFKTEVVGADIAWPQMKNPPGTVVKIFDYRDKNLLEGFGKYYEQSDVTIIEGSRSVEDAHLLFGGLFRWLKPRGFFVIEVQGMVDVFRKYKETGKIESSIISEEDKEYIERHIDSCEIKEGNANSFIVLIRKNSL